MPVRKESQLDIIEDYRNFIIGDRHNSIMTHLISRCYSKIPYTGGRSANYRMHYKMGDGSLWINSEEKDAIDKEEDKMGQSLFLKWSSTKESTEYQGVILGLKNKSDVEPILVSQYYHIRRSHVKSIVAWFDDLHIDESAGKILAILKIPFSLPITNKEALFLCKREWISKYRGQSTPFDFSLRQTEEMIIKNDENSGDKFIYSGASYQITGNHTVYSEEHKKLLVIQEADKERKEFEKLKRLYDSDASKEIKRNREPIPEDVRIAVWRRDSGCCVKCGSKERLEYDHVIPFSKGGSNTVRNIQLLCEKCNREKSNRI